ncbi:iron-containing alcohol dehydrogenase [candidate division KSB1 bacterium]|nr:iron-containing alcohol dehydrogenase [candidate division KSB1 bacterium]
MPLSRHTWSFPTRIEYGPGALEDLVEIVRRNGGRSGLLVTDKGLERVGTPERVRSLFKKAGIALTTFDEVQSNPTDDNVYQGTEVYKKSGCDFIVALGGGSPIDAAKCIKCLVTHEGPLEKYDDMKGGDKFIVNPMPPLYAVPTTAGTGSEVGRSGVITIRSTRTKTIIFSPLLMPTIAVLDPDLTVSMPPKLTAATGVDALVHNLEAYIIDAFHPFADGIAWKGIALCIEQLPRAVKNGQDISARGNMLVASAMGATAFQKGLGINHSIAHALGVLFDTHHGLANAAVLLQVMKFNAADPKVDRKLASLGILFETQNQSGAVLDKLGEWLQALDMPVDLGALNIPRERLEEIEAYALKDPCCSLNPRPVAKGDIVSLLERIIP